MSDPGASLKGTIDTSSLLASALERLNRKSVVGLLDRLMDEITTHYSGIDAKISAAKQEAVNDIGAAKLEIKQTTDGLGGEVQALKSRVTTLEGSLSAHLADYSANLTSKIDARITSAKPGIINDAVTTVMPKVTQEVERLLGLENLAAVRQKISDAQADIAVAKAAADSLNVGELAQVTKAIDDALKNRDLSSVVASTQIPVNGAPVRFDKLLEALANQPKVVSVSMSYAGDHITGANFTFSNNTSVVFTAVRNEQAEQLVYTFSAGDMFGMSGLDGEFSLTFQVRSWQKDVCGKTLSMKQYDAVKQTNVVFNLAIG